MSDLSEDLLTAYQGGSVDAFSALAKRLHSSTIDRRETAARLLQTICETDAWRAEVAAISICITGIASEPEWKEKLLQAAERVFTPETLAQLVEEKEQRARTTKRAFSPRLRLLRIIMGVIAKQPGPRAMTFLDGIQKGLAGTSLEPYIKRWREG